jgi:predicted helicase
MINTISWTQVDYNEPNYFFVPKSEIGREAYDNYLSIADIMPLNVTGIVTSRDEFVIDTDQNSLQKKVYDFCDKKLSDTEFQAKYNLSENYQRKISEQRAKSPQVDMKNFVKIAYRPFDERWIYYQDNLVFRMRSNVMQHFVK